MKKPFDCFFAGQEPAARGDVGEEAVEPAVEALSYSARRQASVQ